MKKLTQELRDNLDLLGLTSKQKKFILLTDGRPYADVAAEAGYSHPRVAVHRLMSHPQIVKNLQVMEGIIERSLISRKIDVLKFWSDVMNGDKVDEGFTTGDRMNAAKNLGTFHRILGHNPIVSINQSDTQINVIVQSSLPTGKEEEDELNRLESAVAEQTEAELTSMQGTKQLIQHNHHGVGGGYVSFDMEEEEDLTCI